MNKAPIPGQSLTQPKGSAQYERPPKHANPEAAFEEYVDRLEDPDKHEGLLSALELGTPLSSIVTLLTREGTRQGYHSVDAAVVIRPMLHEYIKTLADAAGIKVKESPTDGLEGEERKRKEKMIMQAKVEQSMSSGGQAPQPEMPEEPMPQEQDLESPEAPQQSGLMQRRGTA